MTSIGRPAWMTTDAARAVMAALETAGGAGCARFVGGCVRNTLIGAPVDDVDIATRLTPAAVTAALQAAGLKAVPTGIEHGTVTAVARGQPFEITTLRRDVETDGRRAVVAFTEDWAEDAQRRDFRLNALYADATGQVFEPVPGGVADALAGRIVFVGDPALRLAEDRLRILRFFRFYAWYGRGEPDAPALAACAAAKDGLAQVSAERISKEMLKLLAAPDPRRAVRLMDETGVLAAAAPAATRRERFETLVDLDPDPLLRLAALLDDDQAEAAAARLRLSNAQKARIVAALDSRPSSDPRADLYRRGAVTYRDQTKLALAEGGLTEAQARERLALADTWTPPRFPLTGEDALAAGLAGPAVGEALRRIEAAWIAGGFAADRKALLAELRASSPPAASS